MLQEKTQPFEKPGEGEMTPQASEHTVTPGMQAYIDANKAYLARRADYIENQVKKWKFDTIAVHGLYSVQDAIEDYQGAIIEPVFMSASQAYRDSDEMAAIMTAVQPFLQETAKSRKPLNVVETIKINIL